MHPYALGLIHLSDIAIEFYVSYFIETLGDLGIF